MLKEFLFFSGITPFLLAIVAYIEHIINETNADMRTKIHLSSTCAITTILVHMKNAIAHITKLRAATAKT